MTEQHDDVPPSVPIKKKICCDAMTALSLATHSKWWNAECRPGNDAQSHMGSRQCDKHPSSM